MREAMTPYVVHCTPATPLRAVARLMTEHRVHAVYVYDYGFEDDETVEPWGLVTDLALAAAALGRLDGRIAREIVTRPLITVYSDESLHHAAQLMVGNRVSHLAVLDPATQRPAGVLSTLDIARVVAGQHRR